MKRSILIIVLLVQQSITAQIQFSLFDELKNYILSKNITMQINQLKIRQMQQSKVAAILSIPDVQGGINGNTTHNTKLPVSILPASLTGGPVGETRAIRIGTNYQTGLSQNLDLKIINVEAWQNYSLAKVNLQLATNDDSLYQKNLLENAAIIYFNIVQLNYEIGFLTINKKIADTLLFITTNKYKAGIVKQQDINDCKINILKVDENISNVNKSIKQQYSALRALAGVADSIDITINYNYKQVPTINNVIYFNGLKVNNAVIKNNIAKLDIKRSNLALIPSVSAFANNSSNAYTQSFNYSNVQWINSNYIGLKINWNLPNANFIANRNNAKYNLLISQKNVEQAKLNAIQEMENMQWEWKNIQEKLLIEKDILDLYTQNYNKNYQCYLQGIIALDALLNSFTNKVNAEKNYNKSMVDMWYLTAKIKINNN